jgi:competence protein ComEC
VPIRAAPAALPVLVALLGFGFAAVAEPRPSVGGTATLVGLGVALGGGAGNALVGAAVGALAAAPLSRRAPVNDAGLVAEVEATVCGRWRRRAELATASARLCPEWLRQGTGLLNDPPRLWISIPDTETPPPLGTTIRARGSLSRFPGLANVPALKPGPWRLRVKSHRMIRIVAPPGPLASASSALRARIEGALDRADAAGGAGTALVRGLVLGDDDELPEPVRRALRRCGLAHLLAVSGFNLTLVVAFVALAAGARARVRSIALPAGAVAIYLAAVGPELSLIRAALMASATLALLASGRAPAPLQALALAALALGGADLESLSEPGLQLSCGATAGLLLFARRWSEAFRPLPRFVRVALAASMAAQIGALPASVAAFSEIAPLAPVVNLLALPWAVAATAAAFAWTLLALLSPVAAELGSPALDALAAPLFVLDGLPPTPWISTAQEGGALAGLVVAALAAMALEGLAAGKRGAVALGVLLLWQGAPARRAAQAELYFADVGQGDAAVVRHGETTLLVDGGGLFGRDVGTDGLRPLLSRLGVRRIDLAIVSHPHRDHCAGLAELSRQVPIAEIAIAPGARATPCVVELARRARRGTSTWVAGTTWQFGEILLEAVSPPRSGRAASGNADSLAVRVRVAGRSILFAGDLERDGERELVARRSDLASDVLKVSHHGSAGSSTTSFLAAVGARWAVVSAGAANPYGHPAPAALARLAASGATVLRTDRDGMVALRWRPGEPMRLELPAAPRADTPIR